MVRTLENTVCGLALVAALLPAALAAQDGTPPPSEETPAPVVSPAVTLANDISTLAAMTPPTLAAVVEQLSVEGRKTFADLLATDWKKRPEWADMLIVLLKGDSLGPGVGWYRSSEKKYDWEWISDRFDANLRAELGDKLAEIAEVVDEAYRALSDERLRESYRAHLIDQSAPGPA